MRYRPTVKAVKNLLLIAVLITVTAVAGMMFGYRRGFSHGEKITNKWWIDQQSQYYDAAEVSKKKHTLKYDII